MTHFTHKAEHTQQFLSYLNSLDPHIQFTTESPEQHGSLLFMNTLVSQAPSGTLFTTVYRKPTHTDQYLHQDSHHSITNKYNIYKTLSHRAWYVWSNQQLLEQENQHFHVMLNRWNYPGWVSTGSKQIWTSNTANNYDIIISIFTETQIKATLFSLWSHIPKDSVKVLGIYTGKWE